VRENTAIQPQAEFQKPEFTAQWQLAAESID
jgi:hypothetical protein